MKKLMSLVCVIFTVFSLTACGTSEHEATSSGETSEFVSESPSEQLHPTQQEASREFVTLSARPVKAKSDMLILQNPETQKYGLYDTTGKEILPCEYGDMKFITVNNYNPKVYVAVQTKGSYGVYDLSGTEIVPPMYDDIAGGMLYVDCIIVQKSDAFGVVELKGNEIVPVQYSNVACSPRGELCALSRDGTSFTVELYSLDGVLQNSFPVKFDWNQTINTNNLKSSISFNNWGSFVTVNAIYGTSKYTVYSQTYDLAGALQKHIIGYDFTGNNYFSYIAQNELSIMNGKTGEKIVSTALEDESCAIFAGSLKEDSGSGNAVGIVSIAAYKNNLPVSETQYIACVNDTPSISAIQKFDKVGPFYQDTAFVVKDGKLFVLDASGNATELAAPFNAPSDAYLLYEGCAVLNNNGYIYVVDKAGNTILSEDGYTDVDWTYYRGEGLIVLTASDGTTQVIDTYGNEVVPQGNSYQQVVLRDVQGEDIEDYSLIYDMTAEKYIFTDNANLRAFESHDEMSQDFVDKLSAGQGWVLWDNVAQCLIAVVSDENGYQICDVAGLSK